MPINRQPLREQIKDEIIKAIVSGEIEAGERLVELRLAEQFGVSQAPIREALRDLEAIGLVISKPNRGTFASEFGGRGMHEIFQVRGALEELATRLAIEQLSSKDIKELQAEVDNMLAAADAADAAGVSDHSRIFHGLIVAASGNQILQNMWQALNIDQHTAIAVHRRRDELARIAATHQPIVDAIASGDVEQACKITREHQEELEAIPDGLET